MAVELLILFALGLVAVTILVVWGYRRRKAAAPELAAKSHGLAVEPSQRPNTSSATGSVQSSSAKPVGKPASRHVFISYASEDVLRAKSLATALSQYGWNVWWDRTIPPGKRFDEVIESALDSANCVIVLWSNASISSRWVKSEAEEGARREVLVPALIEEVKIPLAFRHLQAAKLVDWNGSREHPEFKQLAASVRALLTQDPAIN